MAAVAARSRTPGNSVRVVDVAAIVESNRHIASANVAGRTDAGLFDGTMMSMMTAKYCVAMMKKMAMDRSRLRRFAAVAAVASVAYLV